MEAIRQFFNSLVKISEEEWSDLAQAFQKMELPKKSILFGEGQKCDFIAFVMEGALRFYYLKDGEERVTAFFFKGDFATNYRSFLTGQVSDHYMETLEDTQLYIINKQDLNQLYDKHKNVERLGRLIAERLYLSMAKRLDSFLYESPEERYKELLGRNSKLLQEVPQYMLASYLGIKPESLSRIRRRKT